MSTKIYNGLKLDVTSLDEVADMIDDMRVMVRAAVTPIVAGMITKAAIKRADRHLSRDALFSLPAASSSVVEALDKVSSMRLDFEALNTASNQMEVTAPHISGNILETLQALDEKLKMQQGLHRAPALDISALQAEAMDFLHQALRLPQTGRRSIYDMSSSLTVFRDVQSGGFYAMLFCDNQKLVDKILEDERLHPYSYWDKTDRPDDLSEDEWAARSDVWGRLLGAQGIPALTGMSFDITSYASIPGLKELTTFVEFMINIGDVPSRTSRALSQARDEWIGKRFRQIQEGLKQEGKDALLSSSAMMDVLHEADKQDHTIRAREIAERLPHVSIGLLSTPGRELKAWAEVNSPRPICNH